jgi:hypothetical protein
MAAGGSGWRAEGGQGAFICGSALGARAYGGDVATDRLLTPKFGKKSDLWVQLDEESVRWREGSLRCIRQKNPRSAICFRSAREQLS